MTAPRLAALAATVAVAVAAPAAARAEPANVVSVPVLALSRAGGAIQGERYLDARFSVAVSLGLRDGEAGDFHLATLATGAELRWWWQARARGNGPHLAARLDLARQRLTGPDGDTASARSAALSALIGWRLVPWRGLELTPALGLATRRDAPSTLAAAWRTTATVGLTCGWMF